MKKKSIYIQLLALTFVGAMLFSSGCENRDLDRILMNEEERQQDAHENPFFWDDVKAVAGYDNLYTLTPLGFTGFPYNDIKNFGDMVLIIGEGYDSDSTVGEQIIDHIEGAAEDTISNISEDISDSLGEDLSQNLEEDALNQDEESSQLSGEDYGFEEGSYNIHYYFMVYDPWMNEVIKTLTPDQISCDSYQVAGDKLFLFNSSRKVCQVFDTGLNLLHTYDVSDFLSCCSLQLFGPEDSNVFYTTNFDNQLIKVTLSGTALNYEVIELDEFCVDIEGISPDGESLVISAIDANNLRYVTRSLSFDDLALGFDFTNNGYFYGSVFNDGFLSIYDYSYNAWQLSLNSNTQYLYMPYSYMTRALGNDQLLIENVNYQPEDCITNYHFDSYAFDGRHLSGFSYEFGTNKDGDAIYLSSDFAYLKDCECIFFISYDSGCHPSILIWDLASSKLSSQEKAERDLTIFDSYDNLKAYVDALPEEEKTDENSDDFETEESYDEVIYGSTVNALSDPEAYDWGALNNAHLKAEELEDTYGIEIYIGPEAPELIDVYYTSQCMEPDELTQAVEKLESILSIYPDNFFSQLGYGNLQGIRIYLVDDIYASNDDVLQDPSGFVNTINNYTVMVLDLTYAWDWNYTVNHEISHMIDRRLEFEQMYRNELLYSEDGWMSYNPEGFDYIRTYLNYMDNEMYSKYPNYFIDSYGSTFPTEDRAEIFGTLVSNYLGDSSLREDARFKDGSPIFSKMKYYADCIEDAFHTEDWPEELPWNYFE